MRKAVIGQVAVLAFMIVGGTALTGLATGDAQWQYYTNNNTCDSKHYIYTFFPKSDKETGKWYKVKVVVPCNEWFKKK
ncbi:MAG: hypothetical protein B6U76_00190 [Desulfurococcales archaeon ex4484_217_2]|nr:MAG: hypothetical protein B6U76_00190 [Desulfurococcales archaeon ex4484_217_2]